MGSSMSAIYDDMEEQENKRRKEWLNTLGKNISNIKPWTSEYHDLKWLMDNKEKLLKQRRLIDILS